MAKAPPPRVTAGTIFFELDRFELGEGDRLELSGRWFGVRGRRFMRPTLTPVPNGDRVRALADLEHKPWAAEDGEPWEAAFPWREEVEVLEAELSVAPDITIRLPAPGSELDRAQRLAALPRQDDWPGATPEDGGRVAPGGDGQPQTSTEDGQAPTASKRSPTRARTDGNEAARSAKPRARGSAKSPRAQGRDRELEALRGEVSTVRAERDSLLQQLETLRGELETSRVELDTARAELETSQAASAESATAATAVEAELAGAAKRAEDAVNRLGAAIAARDLAAMARDDLEAKLDRERRTREQLTAERDRAMQAARQSSSELEQARATLEQAARERQAAAQARDRALGERDALVGNTQRLAQERDEAVAARGAALVMRNATRAMSRHEHHAGWTQRGVVLLVLIGAAIALLFVLHVL